MTKKQPAATKGQLSAVWIAISTATPVAVFLLHLLLAAILNGTDGYALALYILAGVAVVGIIIELFCMYKMAGYKKSIPILAILVLTTEAVIAALYATFIAGF